MNQENSRLRDYEEVSKEPLTRNQVERALALSMNYPAARFSEQVVSISAENSGIVFRAKCIGAVYADAIADTNGNGGYFPNLVISPCGQVVKMNAGEYARNGEQLQFNIINLADLEVSDLELMFDRAKEFKLDQ
ncbi:MAG: hypothetical protein ABIH72_04760 [archaeon]